VKWLTLVEVGVVGLLLVEIRGARPERRQGLQLANGERPVADRRFQVRHRHEPDWNGAQAAELPRRGADAEADEAFHDPSGSILN
jgi:hypothetical protein